MMKTETQNKKGFRFSVAAVVAIALVLALALTACSSGSGNGTDSGAGGDANQKNGQTAQAGEGIVIPVGDISETAQFYPATVEGTKMEVVAVKASDGTIRTAFNTCQVCNGSPKAYFMQSGAALQCQNCGNEFPMDRVEMEAGGCNPVPIFDEAKIVTDETITIPYETLQENAYRFPANWKQ